MGAKAKEEKQRELRKIYVTFLKSNDYRVIAATGAWGGLSPDGTVIIDFFIERRATPKELELLVDENGKIVTEKPKVEETVPFVRELQIGVSMAPPVAYAIGKCLLEKAEAAGFSPDNKTSV